MTELFAPVCSIAATRRRRFLWAAWWTAPPTRDPFRKPDASSGGARTRAEALREAERVAGRSLLETDARWARAWARTLIGQPPFTAASSTGASAAANADGASPSASSSSSSSSSSWARPPRTARSGGESIWAVLGVTARATVEEIKTAFRKRALATHPDHGGEPDEFRRLRRAFDEALARRR